MSRVRVVLKRRRILSPKRSEASPIWRGGMNLICSTYLLAMTQLEAEEQVKLLRRRKLS